MAGKKSRARKTYRPSSGKNKALCKIKRQKQISHYRNAEKGKNPNTGLEYYLLSPDNPKQFNLKGTYQTRWGAENAKGSKADGTYQSGLLIYESAIVREKMNKLGPTKYQFKRKSTNND